MIYADGKIFLLQTLNTSYLFRKTEKPGGYVYDPLFIKRKRKE